MTIVVPNEGEANVLAAIAAKSLTVRLYTAVTGGLDDSTVLADFTEATFDGYAADAITPTSGWTVTPGAPSDMTADAASVFTAGASVSSQTILGYYVENTGDSVVEWAEPFASSITVQNENDAISVTAKLELQDTQD